MASREPEGVDVDDGAEVALTAPLLIHRFSPAYLVYVSDIISASCATLLSRGEITHVVNCAGLRHTYALSNATKRADIVAEQAQSGSGNAGVADAAGGGEIIWMKPECLTLAVEDEIELTASALLEYFGTVNAWIDAALAAAPTATPVGEVPTSVLIFCETGKQVAPVVAAAFAMHRQGLTAAAALARVERFAPTDVSRERRAALIAYEAKLGIAPPAVEGELSSGAAAIALLQSRLLLNAEECRAAGRSDAPTPASFAADGGEALARFGEERLLASLITPINQILPQQLFVGNLSAADSWATLSEHGVTHVVSCVGGGRAAFPDKLTYHSVDIGDTPAVDITAHFSALVAFIDASLSGSSSNRVLVHCSAGASRSVALIIAYLMTRYGLRAGTALEAVQYHRCIANPNEGFRRQLLDYERVLFE